jgi:predicted RNA polymerase sigma factor
MSNRKWRVGQCGTAIVNVPFDLPRGPQAGLERLAAFFPKTFLPVIPAWHAVIGELHFRLGRHSAAECAWREALRFTTARADREFLRRRLAVCRPDGGEPATE